MYQAFYRKWRPRTFDEVYAQDHITTVLKNQVKTGRISHAYLFVGSRGTGKTSCAKILARAVNCENPQDGNPCNVCKSCMGIESGAILDVVELDAASNNGVDNVRALRDEAIFSPAAVKMRVYIVDEVHMLSSSAFNALLKILEEPPEHLMFILATTELNKVPKTILSRCQRHTFRRISTEDLVTRVMEIASAEGLDLSAEAAAIIASMSEGSFRDALSLLDQCAGAEEIDVPYVLETLGLSGSVKISELFEAVLRSDYGTALKIFDELWAGGKTPQNVLLELCSLIRDILIIKIAPSGGGNLLSGSHDRARLSGYAQNCPEGDLIRAITDLQRAVTEMRDGAASKIQAEVCLVALCGIGLSGGESRSATEHRIYEPLETAKKKAPDEPPWDTPSEESGIAEETAAHTADQQPPADAEANSEAERMEAEDKPIGDLPEVGAESFIESLLKAAEGKLPIGTYNLICDQIQASVVYSNGVLSIRANNQFALTMIGKTEVLSLIAAEAGKIAGGPIKVDCTLVPAEEREKSSLDALSRHKNVKFI